MGLLQELARLIQVQDQKLPQVPAGQDPAKYGYPPDITYNTNPNVDLPYSAHTPLLSLLGNLYTRNPNDPRVAHIDPGLFGYPADGPGGVNPNNVFRQLQGSINIPGVNQQIQGGKVPQAPQPVRQPASPQIGLSVQNLPNTQQIRL